ncbi:MAG: hypothetical protein WC866_00120 [Patescibacteria group bacterium]
MCQLKSNLFSSLLEFVVAIEAREVHVPPDVSINALIDRAVGLGILPAIHESERAIRYFASPHQSQLGLRATQHGVSRVAALAFDQDVSDHEVKGLVRQYNERCGLGKQIAFATAFELIDLEMRHPEFLRGHDVRAIEPGFKLGGGSYHLAISDAPNGKRQHRVEWHKPGNSRLSGWYWLFRLPSQPPA